MATKDKHFEFQFSLDILNHLGRGLYRSFATVVAEAVSNAWDAEATLVEITINKRGLVVKDNGKGMDSDDFQKKFLKVGYSRRTDKNNVSKRKVIGRKGIGKLAMLSVSEKVTILSKKAGKELIGGKINNPELDKQIRKEGNYSLGKLTAADKRKFDPKKVSGTEIIFEKIKTTLNSKDIIRKYLATQFNFIFSIRKNDKFEIIVNGKKICEGDLKELDDSTQFVWFLGKEDKGRVNRYVNLDRSKVIKDNNFDFEGRKIEVKGFIASVKEPKNLLLRGSGGDYKANINLFCNGRLRQENLFEEITSKRITEEYLYGEIHVDGFEDKDIDRFTSSREGILKDDPLYQVFLKELKRVQSIILNDWSPWRSEFKDEGDIDDGRKPKYEKRLEDSKNWREKDFKKKIEDVIDDPVTKKTLKDKIEDLSHKNVQLYQDIFILENIFRTYLKAKNVDESFFDLDIDEQKQLIDRIKNTKGNRQKDEERHALRGKIVKEEHFLNYTDLHDLSEMVDLLLDKDAKKPTPKRFKRELTADAKEIGPVRNPVMHTNEITDTALEWDKVKNVINYVERISDK